jgi:hypothetical protein
MVNNMRKIFGFLFIFLFLSFWFVGSIQTYTNPYIIGIVSEAYLCNGVPDWGGGGVDESFERSEGLFCTDDWVESDSSSSISTFDTTFSPHLTHGMKITYKDAWDASVTATPNSALNSVYLRWYALLPDLTSNADLFSIPLILDAGGDDALVQVRTAELSSQDRVYLYVESNLSSEYYVYTQDGDDVFRFELHVVDDGGTCTLRMWKNGVRQTESGGNADQNLTDASAVIGDQAADISTEAQGAIAYFDFIQMSTSGWIGE